MLSPPVDEMNKIRIPPPFTTSLHRTQALHVCSFNSGCSGHESPNELTDTASLRQRDTLRRKPMPGSRSRVGCGECRRRKRKCDEEKPVCGPCVAYGRPCNYSLRLVWAGGRAKASELVEHGQVTKWPQRGMMFPVTDITRDGSDSHGSMVGESPVALPTCLPNGIRLPPRYHQLLCYFATNVLASISCHTTIHQNLCNGLIPASLHSPQLLSACLALSAASYSSRAVSLIDGANVVSTLAHLQSSGLALLRRGLQQGHVDETLLATCLIWSLTDVYAYRQGASSWRVHLQGIRGIVGVDEAFQQFAKGSGVTQRAMRYLYLVYVSLQTLPQIQSGESKSSTTAAPAISKESPSHNSPVIDEFLGYSEELLHVLKRVNQLSQYGQRLSADALAESDMLLGKVKGMIIRDSIAAPGVSISLSPEYDREFLLTHKTFQQATLIHMYRRLYRLPSGSEPIQDAVRSIQAYVSEMIQGELCHTWVAMAMPIFTIGCEAFTEEQKRFVLDKVDKFDCLGSLHVGILRQILEEMWNMRETLGDTEGTLCASYLLEELQYNIVLF